MCVCAYFPLVSPAAVASGVWLAQSGRQFAPENFSARTRLRVSQNERTGRAKRENVLVANGSGSGALCAPSDLSLSERRGCDAAEWAGSHDRAKACERPRNRRLLSKAEIFLSKLLFSHFRASHSEDGNYYAS